MITIKKAAGNLKCNSQKNIKTSIEIGSSQILSYEPEVVFTESTRYISIKSLFVSHFHYRQDTATRGIFRKLRLH